MVGADKAPAAAARAQPTAVTAASETGGEYWVQVGAFRDRQTALELARRLRERNYRVEESTTTRALPAAGEPATPAGGDRYDVVVSGPVSAALATRLAGRGLLPEPRGQETVVRPSLALRDAVSLSRELTTDGVRVQVRRVAGPARAAGGAPAAVAPAVLHRVRVGGFADRATALAALRKLEAEGHTAFVARGGPSAARVGDDVPAAGR
jgi:hypothetical protein